MQIELEIGFRRQLALSNLKVVIPVIGPDALLVALRCQLVDDNAVLLSSRLVTIASEEQQHIVNCDAPKHSLGEVHTLTDRAAIAY